MPKTILPEREEIAKSADTTSTTPEDLSWTVTLPPKRKYALTAVIRKDGDAYSATVPLLPGGFSCGDTVDEAKANIAEAVAAVIESYLENEGVIPWREEPEEEPTDNDTLYAFTVDV